MTSFGVSLTDLVQQLCLGGIVSFPTETVYALSVDAYNHQAILNLHKLKNRPINKPFAVLIDSFKSMLEIACISSKQEIFIKKLIPGPVTFVLHKRDSDIINDDIGNTIAVRVPDHFLALDVIRAFKKPLIATSANIAGERAINDGASIKKAFNDVYVIDDALYWQNCIGLSKSIHSPSYEIGSTVVSLIDDRLSIMRKGPFDDEVLFELWEDIVC